MKNNRNEKFRKNTSLEDLLKSINKTILNKNTESNYTNNPPVYFIIGAPRSGTTLLFQSLSNTKSFSYPSNFISRFYNNPAFGLQVQELLTNKDYHFQNEFSDVNFSSEIDFKSSIGKTNGILSPNEFWYFWRRFFDEENLQYELKINKDTLIQLTSELSNWYSILEKPLLFKGLLFNEYIDSIKNIIPEAKFIFIRRDLHDNSKSLLNTRKTFFGDTSRWYSFKTTNYDQIKDRPAEEQVVLQINQINNSIEKQLNNLPNTDYFQVSYEEYCKNPNKSLENLFNHFKLNIEINFALNDVIQFKMTEKNIEISNFIKTLENERK